MYLPDFHPFCPCPQLLSQSLSFMEEIPLPLRIASSKVAFHLVKKRQEKGTGTLGMQLVELRTGMYLFDSGFRRKSMG